MNQRWGWKKELDDDRERKMKRRKNKKNKRRRTRWWNTRRAHLTIMSLKLFSLYFILSLPTPYVESQRFVMYVPKVETKKT